MNDRRSPLVQLFLLGLVFRLVGLLFNGMADLCQILLQWGFNVRRDGLIAAFDISYGIFSYGLYGLAARAADFVPRFWWAPYKLMILGFDIAVLLALLRLVPAGRKRLVLLLYWLNPWFVLHEAFHGFWEGPHVVFGLLAVLAAGGITRPGPRWFLVGAFLTCSAMFKPQGLIHFIGPLGLYLGVQALRGVTKPLVWFVAGIAAVAVGLTATIVAAGGAPLALVNNYRSALTLMAGISNGGPGLWRFVTFMYMSATGQNQTIPFVKIPKVAAVLISAIAAAATFTILTLFALRTTLKEDREDSARVVLMVLALGSLVISQFGVRAHINHTYPAMVLLVPLAIRDIGFRRLWVAMCALLGISHLLVFALGGGVLLPPEQIFSHYPAAQGLIATVTALPAYSNPDILLRIQLWASRAVGSLPGDTIVSWLSLAVFVVACLMVRAMFGMVSRRRAASAI